MAIGSHNYIMTAPDGEGHWAIKLNFRNSVIANRMPEQIVCSHDL